MGVGLLGCYPKILSFANLSMSCFVPQVLKATTAFLLAPAPSTEITVPSPNFWWRTVMPSMMRSGLEASKGSGLLLLVFVGE